VTMEELIAQLNASALEKVARMQAIVEGAQAANRANLNETEQAEYNGLKSDVAALSARVIDLGETEERERTAAEVAERLTAGGGARVTNEPRVYSREAARQGVSFFRDLKNKADDPEASARLARHQREMADAVAQLEQRDVGTGAFSGLVVPQYLTDLVAPLRRAGRPVGDIANKHPLPPEGMTVNISRITTGSGVAVQTGENVGATEVDMDDTLLTVDVRTLAGMQDVSRQAIDRGTGIDDVVIQDLTRAYNTELDNQLLNGSGAAGQHRGIRNVVGIIPVTYTDATPTAAELYPKQADLIQQIQAGVFMGISHFVMHPRRWWWIAKELGATFPLLQMPGTAPQVAGNAGDTSYEATNRLLFGVPVILDGNIPVNLGAGVNEDVILGVTAEELHLWEDADAPMLIRAEQAIASQLSVRFVLFGYSAFTAGRYPAAHGTVSGTGLITPAF
jgi:HK97 family phage major capsid protein